MTRLVRSLAVTAAAGALIVLPQVAEAQQFPGSGNHVIGFANYLVADDSEIFVKYLGYEAAYEDVLGFSLSYGGTDYEVFTNKTSPVGTVYRLNDFLEAGTGSSFAFMPGEEIIFSLFVADVSAWPGGDDDDAGKTYYTGDPTRNPDGQHHAKFATYSGTGSYSPLTGSVSGVAGSVAFDGQVGFEDILYDGDKPDPDSDFDDLVFATSGVKRVPEPISLALMGTGLVGIMGVAYRRREEA